VDLAEGVVDLAEGVVDLAEDLVDFVEEVVEEDVLRLRPAGESGVTPPHPGRGKGRPPRQ
jgi:hypothetical protein